MLLRNWVPSNWGKRVWVEKPTSLSAEPLRSDRDVRLAVCSTCLCPTWSPHSYVIMFAIISLHHIIHWQVGPKLLLPLSLTLWNIKVWGLPPARAWMMIKKKIILPLFCLFYTPHRKWQWQIPDTRKQPSKGWKVRHGRPSFTHNALLEKKVDIHS